MNVGRTLHSTSIVYVPWSDHLCSYAFLFILHRWRTPRLKNFIASDSFCNCCGYDYINHLVSSNSLKGPTCVCDAVIKASMCCTNGSDGIYERLWWSSQCLYNALIEETPWVCIEAEGLPAGMWNRDVSWFLAAQSRWSWPRWSSPEGNALSWFWERFSSCSLVERQRQRQTKRERERRRVKGW